MNWIEFIILIRMIYGKGKLDLNRIQKMGLLAVKIGQVHALRIDFLDPKKCAELAKLYRFNVPVPNEDVLKYVDKSAFAEIDDKPLATASVGQVYKAKLKTGKSVIIKIIKGRFKRQFTRDVKSLRRFLKVLLFFYPKLKKVFDPMGILRHIEEYTLAELDLRNEVKGHDTLLEIYEKHKKNYDFSKLRFPKMYKEFSGENVLVSEYIDGRTFDDLLDEKKISYSLLLDLFSVHGYYMFKIGTFHGDIHPGNIMLKDNLIYFLDTGAISHADKRLSQGLLHFFDGLSEADYNKCVESLNKMAIKGLEGARLEAFRKKFFLLYKDFKDSTVSQVSLTRKMMETIKLAVNSGMEFEQGMFPIIKSLMFLDGMVLRCNPDAVLMRDMKKFVHLLV